MLFIFAVVGKEIYSESYIKHYDGNSTESEMPRWNLVDFSHSFMIVFRVLCGEWIEPMWDCLEAHSWTCVPYFLGMKIIAGFVVSNKCIIKNYYYLK